MPANESMIILWNSNSNYRDGGVFSLIETFYCSILSRTLIAACADNDVNTVRRLLGDGTNTINEGTDDGESLLSLACSAGYYELAQVCRTLSYSL